MNSIVLFAHGISQTRPKFVRLCLRKGKKNSVDVARRTIRRGERNFQKSAFTLLPYMVRLFLMFCLAF
jgi:hypothetical protein